MTAAPIALAAFMERVERIRVFAADSIETGHDRAVLGNLYAIRDECDAIANEMSVAEEAQAPEPRGTLSQRDGPTTLDRYRYAVDWLAADSWDGCSDCRSRLVWARQLDDKRLTADELANIGREYLRHEGRAYLAQAPDARGKATYTTSSPPIEAVVEALREWLDAFEVIQALGQRRETPRCLNARIAARAALDAYQKAAGSG